MPRVTARVARRSRVLLSLLSLLTVAACERKAPAPPLWESLPLGTSASFRGMWFTDADHGWIVGGAFDIPGGLIGGTRDGGKTWRYTNGGPPNVPSLSGCSFAAVHFFDAKTGLAAGDCGSIFSTVDAGGHWDGIRNVQPFIFAMQFADDRNGWAIGGTKVLRTTDAGQSWSSLDASRDVRDMAPRAIQFLDERLGWLAGRHGGLMRTDDGGETWTAAALPLAGNAKPDLNAMHFVDRDCGWVVGDNGTILRTLDGGQAWVVQETGVPGVRSEKRPERIQLADRVVTVDTGDRTPGLTLSAVRFVSRDRGWVLGYFRGEARSLILHTRDGGATWKIEADITGEELNAIFVVDADRVWAVGARVRPGMQSIYRRAASAAPARVN